jgi:hypothetical protein
MKKAAPTLLSLFALAVSGMASAQTPTLDSQAIYKALDVEDVSDLLGVVTTIEKNAGNLHCEKKQYWGDTDITKVTYQCQFNSVRKPGDAYQLYMALNVDEIIQFTPSATTSIKSVGGLSCEKKTLRQAPAMHIYKCEIR